jgi:hypothetical protein
MANIYATMTKVMLDWTTHAATPTQPAGFFMGLCSAAPTSVATNEVAAGSGYIRATCLMQAAVTTTGNLGSASNTASVTFGPFSSSQAIPGLFLTDSISTAAGTVTWFGNFTTARTPLPGDTLVVAIGALTITLQ